MMINGREWSEPEILAYMKNHEAQTEQLENIIDRLEAENEKLKNKWIKCEDELPEANRMVIVACYGSDIIRPNEGESIGECMARLQRECISVTIGFIGSDGWYDSDYYPMIISPTYWQPLPEPPKESE